MARSTLQVRLVTAAAGLAAIFTTSLVAGCGTGQVAETALITAAVPGGSTSVPVPTVTTRNSAILIQNATVVYNGPAGYAQGSNAPLALRVINQTPFPVAIGPGDVLLSFEGKTSPAGTLAWADARHQAAQSAPSPTPSETPSGNGSPSPSGNGSPSPSGSPSGPPTPTPSPTPAVFDDIVLAPFTAVDLNPQAGQYLEIQNLSSAFSPGTLAEVHLNLKVDASREIGLDGKPTGRTVETYPATVIAPFATPVSPVPRVSR